MLSCEIEYINHVSYASTPENSQKSEWPPHPDRLFSALISSWSIQKNKNEEKALKWLETQSPPDIVFPEAHHRDDVSRFVPVSGRNEKDMKYFNNGSIFEIIKSINRKERFFPAVILPDNNPKVHMIWKEEPPKNIFDMLVNITSRVSRIGHSASLVRASINKDDHHSDHRYTYDKKGRIFLRCPYKNRFDELKTGFEINDNSDWHPSIAPTHRYTEPTDIPMQSKMGDEWIIISFKSGFIPTLEAFPILAKKMRNKIIALADKEDTVHELISGHTEDKKPLQKPHLAIIPLANVGWEFSNGNLLGLALILPADSKYGTDERRQLRKTITQFFEHAQGELKIDKTNHVQFEKDEDNRHSLRTDRYISENKTWASVTPIALDKYPKKKKGETFESVISDSCIKIGLPKPKEIKISRYSNISGSPPAFASRNPNGGKGWMEQKQGFLSNRLICHAVITFDKKVSGPIIIGAGRYYGFGLCIPYKG